MTPIFLNPSHREDHLTSSSSNSLFLNPTHQNQTHPPQPQHQGDSFGSQVHKDHPIESKGQEFSTWNSDQNQIKWMSSKMRVMLKMKKSDHKLPTEENHTTSSTSNIPIRVCSDCNTTKTPLWRSGPRGPKSLCNACGIRQRKARRAAAIAENGNNNVSVDQSIMASLKVTKTTHKDHKKPSNGYVTKYKKKQYSRQITIPTPSFSPSPSPSPSPLPSPSSSPSSSSSPVRKNCVEEFLVSLNKNLTLYRVFPQDEREAAILLMALSCGYAHEN